MHIINNNKTTATVEQDCGALYYMYVHQTMNYVYIIPTGTKYSAHTQQGKYMSEVDVSVELKGK